MEELSDTDEIITKLKSSLPICRVCLDFSMEYIEFEATLCVVDGREVTFSEGFHELIADNKDSTHQDEVTTNFCATCGKDLLNAYLFMKRIEHANYALSKVKILTEESTKFLVDDHDKNDNDNDGEEDKSDVIYFSNQESESCKENDEIYKDKLQDTSENTGSNISTGFDELVKMESLMEECEHDSVYDHDVSLEKHELLSEPETQIIAEELDILETDSSKRDSQSALWLINECGLLCEREENALEKREFNSYENNLSKCIHSDNLLDSDSCNIDHNNQASEIKDYICIICSSTFQTKRSLSLHIRHTHKITETNYQKEQEYKKCQHCRRIIRKSNMEKHLATHSTEIDNVYNCTFCEETFSTKIALKQHSYTHTKNHNRYTCQICGKVCLRPFTLRNHIQAKHMSERRKHQCEDCGLFFSFPSLLKEHRRKHNISNRFKCSHCDRTFVRKPQLDIHMRYHLNDYPYKCDQCDKCYVSKSNLTDHITSKHTKITYDCNRCKQKFKSQTGLRKHKYTHDGYPYNCPLCSVGQTSRSGMKQHLMGVHKDALTEEEFDVMFPIIIPKTGYRRPKQIQPYLSDF